MLQATYRRNLTRGRLEEFCRSSREQGVRVCGDFIIGLNSDEAAVDRMLALAERLRLDYASFNLLVPLFGSRVREQLVREGTLDPFTVGMDTSGTYGRDHERALVLRNRAARKFYLRPSYLLRRLASVRGREEFLIQFQEMTAMVRDHLVGKRGGGS
jgi:hypothetical protein